MIRFLPPPDEGQDPAALTYWDQDRPLPVPVGEHTLCLVCRARRPQTTQGWLYIGTRVSQCTDEPFAGYFCSHTCRTAYRLADTEERMALIFGSVAQGADLLYRLECGAVYCQTIGVFHPVFWPALPISAARCTGDCDCARRGKIAAHPIEFGIQVEPYRGGDA